MIPASVTIVGIAHVEFDAADGVVLRVHLSDGSTAACWWGTDDLVRCMAVVTQPKHAPVGVAVN